MVKRTCDGSAMRPLCNSLADCLGDSMRSTACVIAAPLFLVTPAFSQAPATRFQCAFTTSVRADGLKREKLDLEFIVDQITGKAVVVANNGMSDVSVHVGSIGFTFMETVKSGAVQTTTISPSGTAVHSRHTMMATGELIPAQHYGICK